MSATETGAATGAGAQPANRLRLSLVDVTFALFCLIPPLLFGSQLLNSDGDAARHIVMGNLMLREGLFANDPFSHSRPLEPIMLTEWGSRIIYALLHEWGGLVAVALFAGLLIGTATALVVLFLRQRGVDPLLAWMTGILSAVLTHIHWLARPHLFSFVAFGIFLFLLVPGSRRRLWPFALLFALWANLHGGFLLGLVLLGACAAGCLAEAWLVPDRRSEWLDLARWYALALAIATAASMVTPQGPLTFLHILELLSNTTMTSGTDEFRSPDFHSPFSQIFLLILLGTVAVLVWRRERMALPHMAMLFLMIAAALGARRNIPLFGMVALPLVALHANPLWRSLRGGPKALVDMRDTFIAGEREATPGLWLAPTVLALAVLGFAGGSVAGTRLVPDRFDADAFPMALVDEARAAGVSGTLFNHFTWGGYLTYAWPEMDIFIDGMTDYFGEEILQDYWTIAGLRPGWVDTIDEYGIDLVLVAPTSGLAYQLGREPDWKVLLEDETAVLLRRQND